MLRVSCETGRQAMQIGSIATAEYCNQPASQDQIIVKHGVMVLRFSTTDGRKAEHKSDESAATVGSCLQCQEPLEQ